MPRILLTFSILLFNTLVTFAQTGDIRGFVYEQETSEPSIYTSVYLKGTSFGGQTNVDGFFTITRVPPGEYELLVTSVGFDTIRLSLSIRPGDMITKKLYLKKSAVQMREVEVSAENAEKKTDVRVSVNKIVPKEIKQLPSVGGEPDLAQYIQILPGVIFSGDQGGQLYIRGGTPIQNKLLLDGMVIYNPFHSIGLYSVIDADIIRGADIYTGGFNAEYGDRISSIMDITTRDGNKKRFGGKVGMNTFMSKAIFEGPIKKEKEGEEGSSSFLLSARTSYLDQTSKSLYGYVDENGLPFSFTDLYGKVSMNSSTGSKVNFFGFSYNDKASYNGIADLSWDAYGIGTNFVLIPSGSSVLVDGSFAYSSYGIAFDESIQLTRYSDISGFNAALNFTNYQGRSEVKYGMDVAGLKTNYLYTAVTGAKTEQNQNATQGAAYLKYKYVSDRWVIEPGFRLAYYASLAEISAEPRLGLKFNMTDKIRLKAAGGFYSQNLLAGTSDRDVVNLFYSFLTGSENLPDEFDGKEVTTRLQKAKHLIAGIELDLPMHLSLNIEGYIKNFNQLENINRDKIYEDNSENADKPDNLKKDYIIETGLAQGIDFQLIYDYRRFYFWAVYSLASVERFDGTRTYWPSFDRRHNVNLLASYSFGRDRNWMASVRWNFGSPFPFTQSAGYYEQMTFPNGITSDPLSQNGNLSTIYAPLNEGRLSAFHRLDLALQHTIRFNKNTSLELNAGVTNAYDRNNIFYINRFTGEQVYQLPILPSIGATLSF